MHKEKKNRGKNDKNAGRKGKACFREKYLKEREGGICKEVRGLDPKCF